MKKLNEIDTKKFIRGEGVLTIRMDRRYPYPTGPCSRIMLSTEQAAIGRKALNTKKQEDIEKAA